MGHRGDVEGSLAVCKDHAAAEDRDRHTKLLVQLL